MKPQDLYHTGIVVDDFDETLDWFTKVAGYRWTDVVEVDQVAHTPEGEITIPMRMAYSGAEPRVELLQTVSGRSGYLRIRVCTISATGPTTWNQTLRHSRPPECGMRSRRSTPMGPGHFSGRTARARPDRVLSLSAAPWNRSSHIGSPPPTLPRRQADMAITAQMHTRHTRCRPIRFGLIAAATDVGEVSQTAPAARGRGQ